MLSRTVDIRPRTLALIALTALFAAVVIGLPLGHQLFHDSLIEPEHCPVHLLQTGLVLLVWGLFVVVLNGRESTLPALRTVPLLLFSPRFNSANRAPPRR